MHGFTNDLHTILTDTVKSIHQSVYSLLSFQYMVMDQGVKKLKHGGFKKNLNWSKMGQNKWETVMGFYVYTKSVSRCNLKSPRPKKQAKHTYIHWYIPLFLFSFWYSRSSMHAYVFGPISLKMKERDESGWDSWELRRPQKLKGRCQTGVRARPPTFPLTSTYISSYWSSLIFWLSGEI